MAPLPPRFDLWARTVRQRLALKSTLVGASLGVLLAAAACALGWWLGMGPERVGALALVVLGALAGAAAGLAARWSDTEVACYLDARLHSDELVTTAVGLRRRGAPYTDAEARVIGEAEALLDGAPRSAARPRIVSRPLWAAPAGLAALSVALWAPTRSSVDPAPGTERVQRDRVAGLETARRLAEQSALDPVTAEALARAAERARRLEHALREGLERREALSRLAEIRDDIQSARLDGSGPAARAGMDAAQGTLRKAGLKQAADALGSGDLVAFDRHMHEAAHRAEQASRARARAALEESRRAAESRGAYAIARLLGESRKRFDLRERDAEILRELAQALAGRLGPEARAALEQMSRTGSPEASAALARALAEALSSLDDAERRALAERLKDSAASPAAVRSLSAEEIEQLAERLSTPEGRQRLLETLRRMARAEPLPEAEHERTLSDAEQALDDAERDLSGAPLPVPAGSADDGPQTAGAGSPASDDDSGRGAHDGTTAATPGDTLRARANAAFDPRGGTFGASRGRVAARSGAGEPAAHEQAATAGAEPPGELRGIEHGELPKAYREQVRRYFQP